MATQKRKLRCHNSLHVLLSQLEPLCMAIIFVIFIRGGIEEEVDAAPAGVNMVSRAVLPPLAVAACTSVSLSAKGS